MKIVSLEAQNVMVLEAFRAEPNGAAMVKVEGKNGVGKTTALDCISMAMEGGKKIPTKPITKGKQKGKITLDLGELVVIRNFSKKGTSSLTVKAKEADGLGAGMKSPQAILDKLTGKLAFDPLSFANMSHDEQTKTLRDIAGIDLDELNVDRVCVYDERRELNRKIRDAEGQLKNMPEPPAGTPDDEIDVGALAKELKEANEHNVRMDQLKKEEQVLELECDNLHDELVILKGKLEAARTRLADVVDEIEMGHEIDTAELEGKLDNASATNEHVRTKKERDTITLNLAAKRLQKKKLDRELDTIDENKLKILGAAQYPVDGLGLDLEAGVVTFNDLPFDQASSAEQLRVSVAMGLALNPELKVLLIRDGSLLDDDNLAMVARMAAEADAQVWIERVGKSESVQVVIEEGNEKTS